MINPRDIPSETVRVATEANAIATQNQTELRSLVETLRRDVRILKDCIKDDIETEEQAKNYARKVMSDLEVDGDSYGVPGVAGIVEALVVKFQAQTTQLHTLQEQVKEARELLGKAEDALMFGVGSRDFYQEDEIAAKEWQNRRDKWLEGTK